MARGLKRSGSRRSEFVGLFACALAILVSVSLLSFDPLDRSWFAAPSALRGPTRNLIGTFGANLSHVLYVVFGLLAWALPILLVVLGVAWLRGAAARTRPARAAGLALLWLSISALLAVTVENVRFQGADAGIVRTVPIPAGGVVGTAVASLLGHWLNEAGTLIVLLTALASALLLATPVSYAQILERSLALAARMRVRLATGWQNWLEHRRKGRERADLLARDQAAAAQEEAKRKLAEARRQAIESRREAVDSRARDKEQEKLNREREKLDREREKTEREHDRIVQETARIEAERVQREADIAAVAARAARDVSALTARGTDTLAARSDLRLANADTVRLTDTATTRARGRNAGASGAKLSPAAEEMLLGHGERESAGTAPRRAEPDARIDPATAARAAAQRTAESARARESAAARGTAITAKLDPETVQPGGRKTPPAPSSAASVTSITSAAAAQSVAAAPLAPAAMAEAVRSLPVTDPLTPDVAQLAAEASDAVRKAREAKAEAESRKKTTKRVDPPADFALPPLTLLQTVNNDAQVTEGEWLENAKVLVSKLKEFDVEGMVQAINPGPVVTTYEYRPEAGVKYSKIVGMADDLCLAMKAEGVRIDRISGKSAVGIEVPNSARETIGLREILESDEFQSSTSRLTLSLGKAIDGKTYITDLRRMPHLLVAGATGSGKSVAVNCMIVSILYKATPDEVRFIMVDPKRIELGVYDGIPHLLVPVVTDCRLASNALRWAVVEMENRYKRLAATGVRSLEQYNQFLKGPEAKKLAETLPPEQMVHLPYIVILIDELADLMMVAGNDVEDSVSRLAAMARAVGIHLVLATQRPSVDVITGVIKANFPSRIAFRVSSKVDSRTILDSNGAEMLLGKGDMLFMPPGSARLQRVHGAFISDGEVQRLVNYLKNQREPDYREDVLKSQETEASEMEAGEMDEMYDDALRVVLETGQASVSHLQRRLRLGYGRAARLVDMMELNGLVGPSQGAKGREILVDRAAYLAQMSEAR